MRDRLYLFLYYLLRFLTAILPKFLLQKLGLMVAKITFHLNQKHRRIIDINLQLCFPQKDLKEREQIALKIYQNFAKFGLDCIQNRSSTKEKILQKVHFDNEEILTQALKSQKALILTTAHYGNWELASLAYAAKFGKMAIVGRNLDSKEMNRLLGQNRTQFDIELIDKKGGLKKMLKALKERRTLGILTDQDCALNESLRLKFFDKEVNYQMGASVIAKKTNALIIPAFIYQKAGIFHIKCFEAMDATLKSIEELTHYQAHCTEEMIKFKPDEYFFFHKRFRSFNANIYKEKR
ncbi:lauroyl acyltransferase [Campylobacter upsaliensis]|uniref:Lipid A biosynthesis lauroyl acyltransferase n=1 Tax=Campylobacter upsaliensis JV21 TaxID=888826 RepID=A0A828QVQ5_CAMUP|nr:lipid A biosynthesis lauroyl acyltransferase [Campylobacter upsaliensis]EAH5553037.1 lauroyl acyltransferase [Campylobacter upsaliensis]EAH8336971.1 lauroyl acyltransferase [Campylobacter upsaliensis]EAH9135673.1 lauroyl acyltransferase [Campylobacter upsaliensis]EAH9147707.1 lauroyl acyltransferase [Campylobacter upsaliensis]EAH9843375.1 lauroyl acyltransferase [Campylobacter upsaliensis]